jgi:small conductance mechanosensitive channel
MSEVTLEFLLQFAVNIASAALILIAALWLSSWAKARIDALAGRHPRIDATLFGFLSSLVRYAILVVAAIFVLGRFGIQTTSLVALLGAAGLAVGLALQGTLSNLAAGVMLILFRPIRRGDFVEVAGQMGTVKEISLFFTELTKPDNIQVILPNGDIWPRAIVNYSSNETRRCDLTFGVSYGADLRRAEAVIREVIGADDRVLAEPEPFVKVANLGESSVDFTVRVWCAAGDWWALKCDLTRAVKEAFDTARIEIPFRTFSVHQI